MKQRIIRWVPYIVVAAIVVLTALSLVGHRTAKQADRKPEISSEQQKSMLEYVNEFRARKGVSPLTDEPKLDASAEEKAIDLAKNNYWSHDRPGGEKWYDNVFRHDPDAVGAAENLGKCFTTREAQMSAWENSPEHAANMLNPVYTKMGEYTVWDADQKCFISVNHFAK